MIKHIKRLLGIGTKPTEVKVEVTPAPVQEVAPVMPTIEIPAPAVEVEVVAEVAPVEPVPAKPKKTRKPAAIKAKKTTK